MLVKLHRTKLFSFVRIVEFLNIVESRVLYKQLLPVKLFIQLHVKVVFKLRHEPPFLQGEDKQALIINKID